MLFDDYDSIPGCHLLRVLLAPPPNNCHSASEMCGRQDVMGNFHYCRHSCHNPCHHGHRNHQHTLKNSIFDLEHSNIYHICHNVLGQRCRLFVKRRKSSSAFICAETQFLSSSSVIYLPFNALTIISFIKTTITSAQYRP